MSDDEEGSGMIKCKITLIGESTVGKTSIIKQYISNIFNRDILSTIGGEREYKSIVINGKKVRLVFWDTAGQEKFRSLSRIFLNKSNIVVFVYDITKRDTFDEIKNYWYNNVKSIIAKDTVLGIAGNKSDLFMDEKIPKEEAEKLAKEIGGIFMYTSAKESIGISDLFEALGKKFLDQILNGKNNVKGNNKNEKDEKNIKINQKNAKEKKKKGC